MRRCQARRLVDGGGRWNLGPVSDVRRASTFSVVAGVDSVQQERRANQQRGADEQHDGSDLDEHERRRVLFCLKPLTSGCSGPDGIQVGARRDGAGIEPNRIPVTSDNTIVKSTMFTSMPSGRRSGRRGKPAVFTVGSARVPR